jgi:parallel beta-helix repeat protein
MVASRATARTAFPIVGGSGVRDASVEGLTIEGNRARRGKLDGCRGGGIYLFECEDITIRDCVVRGYNGDGISFQVSQRVTVQRCTVEGNAGLGLHPGSGSQHPVVKGNHSTGNDGDGLFVCWRVKFGVFEGNELRGNAGAGVSIGHKDTDNLFRGNVIAGNRSTGVLFRDETEPMGAHRNVFENNRIVDNGGSRTAVAVTIRGHHRDLVFRGNTIGATGPGASTSIGILRSEHAEGLRSEGNRFVGVRAEVEPLR